MPIFATIRSNLYKDSVALMRVSERVLAARGVQRATMMMGTPANKAILAEARMMSAELEPAAASDLMVVVEAESTDALDAAMRELDALLDTGAAPSASAMSEEVPSSLALAVARGEHPAIAQISVPGPYAGAEALKALKQGMHVFLFSDNVDLGQERVLKSLAEQRALLVMGPDCGTSILRGVPLGFANVVRRGSVGLVGASGTGLQEVMCRVDALGEGISHAIGTGGHDVHEAIGGTTMCQAIDLLADDVATRVIAIVSKPPARSVADKVLQRLGRAGKPSVVLFLGGEAPGAAWPTNVAWVTTLHQTAATAVAVTRGEHKPHAAAAEADRDFVAREVRAMAATQRFVHGLYSGGTFALEAQLVWSALGLRAQSNAPLDAARTHGLDARNAHRAIDFGADEYTVGRPHPMIDPGTRIAQLMHEGSDASTAVVVLDVVLGYGAHEDPAGALAPAIADARATAARAGRYLAVVAFVCGTERDPQRLSVQQSALRDAGAIVAANSTDAARLAGAIAVASHRAAEEVR